MTANSYVVTGILLPKIAIGWEKCAARSGETAVSSHKNCKENVDKSSLVRHMDVTRLN
jgi:hypothetical protein